MHRESWRRLRCFFSIRAIRPQALSFGVTLRVVIFPVNSLHSDTKRRGPSQAEEVPFRAGHMGNGPPSDPRLLALRNYSWRDVVTHSRSGHVSLYIFRIGYCLANIELIIIFPIFYYATIYFILLFPISYIGGNV